MRVLVTGLHRSGTSVTASLFAKVTGLSLLDDPQWAIFHERMARAFLLERPLRSELEKHEVVKCPRMAECLGVALEAFPRAHAVYLVRDPRDVLCSIIEAQRSSDPSVTTMIDNDRFGSHDTLWQGVALAFNAYAHEALAAHARWPSRVVFVAYPDLYSKPSATITALATRLGVEVVGPFPDALASQQLAPRRNKAADDQSIKGPGRWRAELDPDSARGVERHCASMRLRLERLTLLP